MFPSKFYSRTLVRPHNLLLQMMTSRRSSSSPLEKDLPPFSLGKGTKCPPLTPGVMRIYSMRFCPYAQRTRLVLQYKQIPHELVNINLKHKPKWLRERYPAGLVPILEKDGQVVYESSVCNDYLDEMYPEPKLTPSDPFKKAEDKMLSETFSKVIALYYEVPASLANDTFPVTLKKYLREMQRYENALEKRGDFFGGAKPCMVDFMIWPWFERIGVISVVAPETDITEDRFPRLAAWMKRMYEIPAVINTYEKPEHHAHFFKTLREGNPEYDHGVLQSNL